MNPLTPHLENSFRAIGARVSARPPRPVRTWNGTAPEPGPRISVQGDVFELTLPPTSLAAVLDCRKAERHLILSLRNGVAAPERFLCGFDERHWFAAAVTGQTVRSAKDSLIPSGVRDAIIRSGMRHADRYRRNTPAFVRQGEWFFVPDEIKTTPLLIHRREPLIRPGGGKAHVVDELIRGQGEMVWHHAQHAHNGITPEEFAALPDRTRQLKGWSRRMRIGANASVHVRGAVRHPDHATIWLPGWHRVYINSERRPPSLGFLD